ncbi:MAG: GIY-YIG nuclease family protein [Dehalococcoidales bacterium]|jgi:putative endonuclease
MYTVYVLRSKSTGKHYTGQTENFQIRFNAHATGLARYTHERGPRELVYSEEFRTRALAMAREKFLKSGQGREWLKEQLKSRARPPEAD